MIAHPDAFRDFFKHVRWADLAQLDATKSISDEEYFKDRGWSFAHIHGVMLHMLAAQEIWRQRFEGEPMNWLAMDVSMTTRDSVEPKWNEIHQKLGAFFERQTPESVLCELKFKNSEGKEFSGPLWRFLTHVLNHSTIHRGQLNSMIKLAGGKPPAVDYSSWYYVTR